MSTTRKCFFVLTLFVAQFACCEMTKTPLRAASESAPTLFRERAPEDIGVNFVNPIDAKHDLKRLYISGFAAGGASVGDFDQDGLLDVVLTSGARASRIYRQVSPWKFEEVAWDPELSELWSSGAAVLDIDNDGDLDIYLCNYDVPNSLYINVTEPGGKIRFEERAKDWGLDISDASLNPSFADYDNDGDIDIFILTSEFKRANGRPKELPINGKDTATPTLKPGFEKYYELVKEGERNYVYYNAGRENILLQNQVAQGAKTFKDVSKEAGIKERTFGLSCTWYDHDNDGDMDLYVCNDFTDPDQLYLNNGNGTFTDVIRLAAPYTSWYAMGSDTADLNNDGRFDLVVADMGMTSHFKAKTTMGDMSIHKKFLDTAIPRQAMRNTCMINTGTGRFHEVAYMAGLANTDWTWAVKLSDFDCDSLVDVFFANGMARKTNDSDRPMPLEFMFGNTEFDFFGDKDTREEDNLAFKNKGDLKFENVSGDWGIKDSTMSYSAATGDLDNDGDPDLIVAHLDRAVSFYENTTNSEKKRLSVSLKGISSNSHGVGGVVKVTCGGVTQTKMVNPMTGYISCNQSVLQFGLGDQEEVEKITVLFPSGGMQTYRDLKAGFHYVITEEKEPSEMRQVERPRPDFLKVKLLESSRHRELPFDDYIEQPLLPWKQSQMGPGIAWADIDGDGDEDCFLSQGDGIASMLSIQGNDRRLTSKRNQIFTAHRKSEDMAPLFFDADSDGRLDLLVTSGSIEHPEGDKAYRDRIHLGGGEAGEFTETYYLPGKPFSSSVAAAADFDRDGDLDLFIGGRVVPGRWPESPRSQLYLNESQPGKLKFELASEEQAGVLKKCQRATSALWTDLDRDGWMDLIVTHEYGPLCVFLNQEGKLIDLSEETGLSELKGVWNGIAARDLDGDGDMDYIVSNFGINTTYKGSKKKPEFLHYGDLDGTGTFRVVEAKTGDDCALPRRGYSCSSSAMPSLKTKLGSYNKFAISSLVDIYSTDRVKSSGKLQMTEMYSIALYNESSEDKISLVPVHLPRTAQLAPGFGVVITELNGDSKPDIVIAQNFFSPQREVGRMSGSSGAAFLSVSSERDFEVHESFQSGLILTGDVKAVTVNEFNGDGVPDLCFTENRGPVSTFLNTSRKKFVGVRINGQKGNTRAIGALLSFKTENGQNQTVEITGGGNYLSQSSNTQFFGLGEDQSGTLRVIWPDGKEFVLEDVKQGLVKLNWN